MAERPPYESQIDSIRALAVIRDIIDEPDQFEIDFAAEQTSVQQYAHIHSTDVLQFLAERELWRRYFGNREQFPGNDPRLYRIGDEDVLVMTRFINSSPVARLVGNRNETDVAVPPRRRNLHNIQDIEVPLESNICRRLDFGRPAGLMVPQSSTLAQPLPPNASTSILLHPSIPNEQGRRPSVVSQRQGSFFPDIPNLNNNISLHTAEPTRPTGPMELAEPTHIAGAMQLVESMHTAGPMQSGELRRTEEHVLSSQPSRSITPPTTLPHRSEEQLAHNNGQAQRREDMMQILENGSSIQLLRPSLTQPAFYMDNAHVAMEEISTYTFEDEDPSPHKTTHPLQHHNRLDLEPTQLQSHMEEDDVEMDRGDTGIERNGAELERADEGATVLLQQASAMATRTVGLAYPFHEISNSDTTEAPRLPVNLNRGSRRGRRTLNAFSPIVPLPRFFTRRPAPVRPYIDEIPETPLGSSERIAELHVPSHDPLNEISSPPSFVQRPPNILNTVGAHIERLAQFNGPGGEERLRSLVVEVVDWLKYVRDENPHV